MKKRFLIFLISMFGLFLISLISGFFDFDQEFQAELAQASIANRFFLGIVIVGVLAIIIIYFLSLRKKGAKNKK